MTQAGKRERTAAEEREEREERDMVHVHTFNSITSVADGHQHIVAGTSAPARAVRESHIHRIRVRTSFNAKERTGHWHWFDVMTGPAIYITDELHIHSFAGETSIDDNHSHMVMNTTAQAPDINGEERPQPEPVPQPPKVKSKIPKH